MEKIGSWAFIIGALIAVLTGLTGNVTSTITTVLVVLGLIVGFLNVTEKETSGFLIATIALIAAGNANLEIISFGGYAVGKVLAVILGNIVVFVAPAAIVVAVKAIYALAER